MRTNPTINLNSKTCEKQRTLHGEVVTGSQFPTCCVQIPSPKELGDLSKLLRLFLYSNQLTGEVYVVEKNIIGGCSSTRG